MRNSAEIALGTNIGFVTRVSLRTATHNHSPPYLHTDNHKQHQTVTSRRRQSHTNNHRPKTACPTVFPFDRLQHDSRHGLLFHLLRQNTKDTHMGCTTLNNSPSEPPCQWLPSHLLREWWSGIVLWYGPVRADLEAIP